MDEDQIYFLQDFRAGSSADLRNENYVLTIKNMCIRNDLSSRQGSCYSALRLYLDISL